jgi:hypothetical protein
MIKLFKWFIGGKIQTILGIVFALFILGTPLYLYITYKNAISDAKRYKFERDELVIETTELASYNREIIIRQDSLKYAFKQDSLMRQGQIEDLQKTLLKQRNIIKERDEMIIYLKSGIPCKNIFGKIVPC